MIAVIQRVNNSSVKVNNQLISKIGKGLMVLLCVTKEDDTKEAEYLADKIVNLRIFADDLGKMNKSLMDINGELQVVSQFTLIADTKKGNRPSFDKAASLDLAQDLYKYFVTYIEDKYSLDVKTGVFAEHMLIDIANDGPVTIIIDSKVNKVNREKNNKG